jgi:hypothetical protein
MKKAIAGLIAGLILGSASIGVAATQGWDNRGPGYKCLGNSLGALCNQTGPGLTWSVMVNKKSVAVFAGERGDPIFACYRGKSKCSDLR